MRSANTVCSKRREFIASPRRLSRDPATCGWKEELGLDPAYDAPVMATDKKSLHHAQENDPRRLRPTTRLQHVHSRKKTPANDSDAAILTQHGKRNISVHDPSSIVNCNGEYWCFSTGRGVPSWRSTDLQTWRRGPRVFPEIPAWVTDVAPDQRGHYWAPDVIRLGDRARFQSNA
ncbi:Extracellular exo-alpha-(1-_5)-L-arabinofuranosidase ArbA precursor [Blastopirellula retiformator]|uniref:Extracellular exo-alpha-(1->5)-L-arabinofuranosidase ArbA n=1 Tax=Blastopirellula retiformator TaxID=2527970 RepID=A0A5C5VA72_9BACT|nr:Extracellular exo-alpha-(1->5)-L-arabinofuranosidase ArbA precursor [Blastopirellula retiformator]